MLATVLASLSITFINLHLVVVICGLYKLPEESSLLEYGEKEQALREHSLRDELQEAEFDRSVVACMLHAVLDDLVA